MSEPVSGLSAKRTFDGLSPAERSRLVKAWTALEQTLSSPAKGNWALAVGFGTGVVAGIGLLGPAPLVGASVVALSFGALGTPKIIRRRRVRAQQRELLFASGFLSPDDQRDATRMLQRIWTHAKERARRTTYHPLLVEALQRAGLEHDNPNVQHVAEIIFEVSPSPHKQQVMDFLSTTDLPAHEVSAAHAAEVRPLTYLIFALARLEAPTPLLLALRREDSAAAHPVAAPNVEGARAGLYMHNDDYTPFELVIDVLVDHVGADVVGAERAARAVDQEGSALLLIGDRGELEALAALITEDAEREGAPLRLSVDSVEAHDVPLL